MFRLAALLAAILLPALPDAARGSALHCRAETLPVARAACLTLAADTIGIETAARMETSIARWQASGDPLASIAAGRLRAQAQALAAAGASRCGDRSGEASNLARAECRLVAAVWREREIDRLVRAAEQRLAVADPYQGFAPRLEIMPLRRGGFAVDVVIDEVAPR